MNLHGQIMNLNCNPENMDAEPNQRLAYKVGHRDARHAAAQLALKADAQVDEIRRMAEDAADRGDVLGQRILRLLRDAQLPA